MRALQTALFATSALLLSATAAAETLPQGYAVIDDAEDASAYCGAGDWCLYGAFILNHDYEMMDASTPNSDYYDPLQGYVVQFAMSFDIAPYDQFTLPDSIAHTTYSISNVSAQFICKLQWMCDDLTQDMDGGGSSGMYLYYDWYTERTSEIPGIFYGAQFGFEIFQPTEAYLNYTVDTLDENLYYPEVTDNKGQAFAVVRRYDQNNWPAMTDFTTGDAFFYLIQQ